MKKYFGILFAIIILTLSFASCGKDSGSSVLTQSDYIKSSYNGQTGYSYSLYKDYCMITGYDGTEKKVEIPQKIESKKVKCIGESAFSDNKTMEEISFPQSLLVIEDNAFLNCTALKKVTFPEKLYSIGASAFSGDTELTTVRFPMELKSIGGYAFGDCKKLENVTVPNAVESIGGGAFMYTPWFEKQKDEFVTAGDGILIGYNGEKEKVSVPDTTKQVSAFYGSYNVKEVILPESVLSIGDYAFANSALEKISFSEKITSVGNNAFDSCMELKEIKMNEKIRTVGTYAFSSCPQLASITIPKNVRTLGDGVFVRCEGLKTVKIEGYNTQIGLNAFESCSSLEKIIGQSGSNADKYSKGNNLRFEVM